MLHAWEGKSGASFRQVLPRTSAMMTPKAKQGHKLNMHAKAFTPLSPSLNQTHPVDKQTQDTRQIYNVTGQKINNPVSLKQIIKVNFNKTFIMPFSAKRPLKKDIDGRNGSN